MNEVTMPKLSDSMEIGRIDAWRVKEGDAVREGDTIADVESDKATMELEAFHDGTVIKIVHGAGDEVPVGEVIAFIGDASEAAPELPVPSETPTIVDLKPKPAASPPAVQVVAEPPPPPAPRASGDAPPISPYAKKLAAQHGVDYTGLAGSGPGGRVVARDIEKVVKAGGAATIALTAVAPPAASPTPHAAPTAAPVASPARDVDPMAAAVARKYDVDLAAVTGTGTGGRVTVQDVMAARPPECCASAPPSPDEELPEIVVTPDEADVTDAPFRLKTQARRVTASKHAIPHFYLTRGVDVTELLERKAELKSKHGASITHAVMWAVLQALKKHPGINRSYDRGKIVAWKHVNLGLAIATDEGLTVAVLKSAEDLTLDEIVAKAGPLVDRAREGKLTPQERQHATFTITNLGMYDVEEFMPVINPPSSITLAVASALHAPVVRGDGLVPGRVMKLTAACDHRVLEGALAAAFMHDLRHELERPGEIIG
jgi:pyruvate dehydrogenase E2 component (dihydrolipoamide acetyltransferase)